ncbi:uncharacterized protein LOC122738316 [Dromiciops gliroides]|uniref:uncharacterized protein LOC122738316 n=1 Tax=Dromiciops gliroides TaxID=33562 RepID=UPI001CC38B29|nr:uncharacterized protein LOC122738316 [Dromiciops gliroides]
MAAACPPASRRYIYPGFALPAIGSSGFGVGPPSPCPLPASGPVANGAGPREPPPAPAPGPPPSCSLPQLSAPRDPRGAPVLRPRFLAARGPQARCGAASCLPREPQKRLTSPGSPVLVPIPGCVPRGKPRKASALRNSVLSLSRCFFIETSSTEMLGRGASLEKDSGSPSSLEQGVAFLTNAPLQGLDRSLAAFPGGPWWLFIGLETTVPRLSIPGCLDLELRICETDSLKVSLTCGQGGKWTPAHPSETLTSRTEARIGDSTHICVHIYVLSPSCFLNCEPKAETHLQKMGGGVLQTIELNKKLHHLFPQIVVRDFNSSS